LAKKKEEKRHPLFAVSGNHEYLRLREVKRVITSNHEQGWEIDHVDGSNISDLSTALSPNDFFESGAQSMVVVSNPEKADLELLEAHYDSDDDIVALLHYNGNPKGNTKFGKFLKKIGKSHLNFTKPKDWDLDAAAIKFCISEAAYRGKKLSNSLAAAMVARVGTDFGFLSFEIMKISILADIEGVTEITAPQIIKGMAPIAEMAIVPVVDAVALKNKKAIIKSMTLLKKNSKYDPTMVVCSYLANAATRWLGVADLRDKKVHLDEAAQRMGLNPWYYKNKVFPQATNWSTSEVIELLQLLADVKRSIFSGQISPWLILSSRILEVCR